MAVTLPVGVRRMPPPAGDLAPDLALSSPGLPLVSRVNAILGSDNSLLTLISAARPGSRMSDIIPVDPAGAFIEDLDPTGLGDGGLRREPVLPPRQSVRRPTREDLGFTATDRREQRALDSFFACWQPGTLDRVPGVL